MARTILATLILLSSCWIFPAGAEIAADMKWAQLSADQQQVLAPLSAQWDELRPWQREKMLEIARDYTRMNSQQQARVQKRLGHWSRMTPFERENARKRYQQFHALSPEKQLELRRKWSEYQRLPEAEREKLRGRQPEPAPEDDLGD